MREIKFRAWDNNKMYDKVQAGGCNPSVYDKEWLECTETAILMQFTGLKDKNGVEIYEGDIVKRKVNIEENIFKVIYSEEDGAFSYKQDNPYTSAWMDGSDMYCEVIGNIYESPELITN